MTHKAIYHALLHDFRLNGPDAGAPLLRELPEDERDRMYAAVYAAWSQYFHGDRTDRLGLRCTDEPSRPIPRWYRESGRKPALKAFREHKACEARPRVTPEQMAAGGWPCGIRWDDETQGWVTSYAPPAAA